MICLIITSTIDPKDPYALSPEEEDIMNRLVTAFKGCEKLQKHIQFFFKQGSLFIFATMTICIIMAVFRSMKTAHSEM